MIELSPSGVKKFVNKFIQYQLIIQELAGPKAISLNKFCGIWDEQAIIILIIKYHPEECFPCFPGRSEQGHCCL